MESFDHRALSLTQKTKIIFIAMTKHVSYFKRHAVKYVLEKGYTPISQFWIFDYFLVDAIDRDLVRRANNNLIRISDEMRVFGPISDGVLAEIKLVKGMDKPIKYFKIIKSSTDIQEISKDGIEMEDEVEEFRNEL